MVSLRRGWETPWRRAAIEPSRSSTAYQSNLSARFHCSGFQQGSEVYLLTIPRACTW